MATPKAPTNIRVSDIKVDGSYLVVTAKWDHRKLGSTNAAKYDVRFYVMDYQGVFHSGYYKAKTVSTNSAELRIPLSKFFPNETTWKANDWTKAVHSYGLFGFKVWVRTNKQTVNKVSYTDGAWGKSAAKKVAKPKLSKLEVEPVLGEGDNYLKYTYGDPTGIFTGFQRRFCTTSTGGVENKKGITKVAKDIREQTENCYLTVNAYSLYHFHTCEIRPYGPQGRGEWVKAGYVFAWPISCAINSITRTGKLDDTYDLFNVKFDSSAPYAVDRCEFLYLCYCKGTPSDGWGVPEDWSWTEIEYSHDWYQYKSSIKNNKPHSFQCKTPSEFTHCDDDEAVFGRVRVCHGNYKNGEGQAKDNATLIACGNPLAPSDIEFNGATKVITWKGNSHLPNLRTLVYAMPAGTDAQNLNVNDYQIADVANPNVGNNTLTWDGAEEGKSYRIGVRNVVVTPVGERMSTCDDSGDDILWTDISTVLPAAATGLEASGKQSKQKAYLTWDEPSSDVDQVEVSWSSNPDAWGSTDAPSTFTIDRRASSWIVEDEKFTEGGFWYFCVRLHNEAGWGSYSSVVSLDMATIPEIPIITLSKNSIVPGDELVVGWTYDNEDETEQESAVIEYDEKTNGISGTDLSCEIETGDFEAGSSVYFRASVKGACSEPSPFSERAELRVRVPVSAELETPDTLTELPLPVVIGEMGDYSSAILRILTDMTFEHTTADGRTRLYESGDCIATYDVDELLSENEEGEITLDPELLGDGSYIVTLTVTDIDGNVATATNQLMVAWADAAELTESVDVTCHSDLTATIRITGDESGDGTLELYRKTADGYQLVSDGVELTETNDGYEATITDPYATYSYDGAAYRLAKRLPNNTVDWRDFPCKSVKASGTTIDFGSEQLRLKYNNNRSDAWEKPFEQRRHLGGSLTGHWQEGVSRTGTYSASAIRIEEADTIEAARRLATHAGEAYIRMSRGIGYPCDIEVSLEESYESQSVSLSLSCTQIDSDSWGGTVAVEEVDDGLDETV